MRKPKVSLEVIELEMQRLLSQDKSRYRLSAHVWAEQLNCSTVTLRKTKAWTVTIRNRRAKDAMKKGGRFDRRLRLSGM